MVRNISMIATAKNNKFAQRFSLDDIQAKAIILLYSEAISKDNACTNVLMKNCYFLNARIVIAPRLLSLMIVNTFPVFTELILLRSLLVFLNIYNK
jgi:hypothetical protein